MSPSQMVMNHDRYRLYLELVGVREHLQSALEIAQAADLQQTLDLVNQALDVCARAGLATASTQWRRTFSAAAGVSAHHHALETRVRDWHAAETAAMPDESDEIEPPGTAERMAAELADALGLEDVVGEWDSLLSEVEHLVAGVSGPQPDPAPPGHSTDVLCWCGPTVYWESGVLKQTHAPPTHKFSAAGGRTPVEPADLSHDVGAPGAPAAEPSEEAT